MYSLVIEILRYLKSGFEVYLRYDTLIFWSRVNYKNIFLN